MLIIYQIINECSKKSLRFDKSFLKSQKIEKPYKIKIIFTFKCHSFSIQYTYNFRFKNPCNRAITILYDITVVDITLSRM